MAFSNRDLGFKSHKKNEDFHMLNPGKGEDRNGEGLEQRRGKAGAWIRRAAEIRDGRLPESGAKVSAHRVLGDVEINGLKWLF